MTRQEIEERLRRMVRERDGRQQIIYRLQARLALLWIDEKDGA